MRKAEDDLQAFGNTINEQQPLFEILETQWREVLSVEDVIEGDLVVGLYAYTPVSEIPRPPVCLGFALWVGGGQGRRGGLGWYA